MRARAPLGRPTFGWVALLVTSLAPGVDAQEQTWRVDPSPSLSIGAVDGPPGQLLVNVLSGTELSDGTIVLRNSIAGTFELRYFDSEGEHVRTVSRFGRGPYEFQYPVGVHRLGADSVIVIGEDDRFAVFGPRGEQVREGRLGMGAVLGSSISHGVDSGYLVVRSSQSATPPTGIWRAPYTVRAAHLETGRVDSVAVVLTKPTHYEPLGAGLALYPMPFGPDSHVAVGGGVAWVGDSSTNSIDLYRLGESTPFRTIGAPFEPRRISRADRARAREAFASRFSGETQRRWARYASLMDFPEQMPAYGYLKVDTEGNLWVQQYEPFWTEGDQQWRVIDQQGEVIASVVVPSTAIPVCARRVAYQCTAFVGVFEIGPDYMLVPQRDELDVRYLRRFAIRK